MIDIFSLKLPSGRVIKGRSFKGEFPGRKNLLIMTGMCEHSLRYEEFATYLNGKGVDVYVLDAFGQGLNVENVADLQKWHVGAFDENVQAAYLKIEEIKKETGRPTYVMGHSMGSFMTQRFLELYPNTVEKAVICSSNGNQRALMRFGYFAARLVVNKRNWDKKSKFLQSMSIGAYERSIKNREGPNDWLSYNRENIEVYENDPYCGAINTNGFWREFLKGMNTIWRPKNLKKLSPDTKLLLIAGDGDPVGRFGKGVIELDWLYHFYGVRTVQTTIYKHMRHEILNETNRMEVFEDVAAFIE